MPVSTTGVEDNAISDSDLVRRIGAGSADRAAERELCRRFGGRIRVYGLRHLRDGAQADDLVQHVLVVVIESLRAGRLREPERLASFVLGACRMVVRDTRRIDARRHRLLEQFGIEPEVAFEPSVGLDVERLRGCVEKLSARERTIVILTFYACRTGEEIASDLAMTLGNVRVARHRAVRQLRTCMGASEVGAHD